MVAAHNLLAFVLTWDTPGTTRIRGLLIVVTGAAILIGSVYLVLATDVGSRLGFLVAIAGLSGWMALMGFVWAMYGIGYKGTAPHWKVEEVVVSQSPNDLDAAKLAKAHDLSKWRMLKADDPARGDPVAAASAAIAPPTGVDSRVKLFSADSDFKVLDAYTVGGKKKNFLNGWLPGPHPPHYTIVQVQAVKQVEVPFGATPPTPEVDPSAPFESVILVRDLGKLRLPSFLIMCASLIVFGVTCNVLHRRDKALWAARALAQA